MQGFRILKLVNLREENRLS